MSLKMHKNVTLGGYDTQVFPPVSLRLLHNLQRRKPSNNLMFLSKVGEVIEEHLSTDRIEKLARTSDGYYWYATMRFRVQSGQVAILFPWSQDWKKRNRSQADRSIAIFADKSVLFEDIDKLVEKLVNLIEKISKEELMLNREKNKKLLQEPQAT